MNILFFMSHGVLARNFEWTLRELAARGHGVHVALDQMHKPGVGDTTSVLEAVARDHPGVTFGPSPGRTLASSAGAGRAFRLVLDYLRYFEPGYAEAEKPRARMSARMPRALRLIGSPLLRRQRGRALLRRALELADEGTPVRPEVRDFVVNRAPDVVLVTPLVDPGSPQTEYIRCARQLRVPSLLAVHSWDNLTVKGGIHDLPDAVAVWNEVQRREAIELHAVPPERVHITGAVAYDHWLDWSPSSSREAFCRTAGLDPKHPFLLYLGSSRFIAPGESEFVREWNAQIRECSPALADVQVLLRPHPLNPFVGALPDGVRLLAAEKLEPFDSETRSDYFDAIHHAAAVVGILTSGLIEAAIVDRPVHTLQVERYRETQRGILHFRHLLPEHGGMLIVARSYREHADQLIRSLRGERSSRNADFASSFVHAPGVRGNASAVLADAVEDVARTRPDPVTRPLSRRAAGATFASVGRALLHVALLFHGRKRSSGTDEAGRPGKPVRGV